MKDLRSVDSGADSSHIPSQQTYSVSLNPKRLCRPSRSFVRWLIKDWHTHKYFCFAALLLLLTIITTVAYYLNYLRPELNADTPAYLHVVDRIQTHPYLLVDTWRLPGYPLLILLVYALAGQGNLMAVSIAQAVLFILATLEVYILAILLLRRAWLAFLIGLLVGTNLVLLSYVKPIMSEGLSLWLLITLVLAVTYFIRTVQVRAFWLIVICALPLLLTRPEWVYMPVPLFAYLLLVAARRGIGRRLLRHVLISLALIYAVMGSYIVINSQLNQYPGLTSIENFNLMGKVLQYDMQDKAPTEYAQISRKLDIYVARVGKDPYQILPYIPELSRDNYAPAGNFARAIIMHNPIEFLLKSVPVSFSSLTSYYDSSRVSIPGPFEAPLAWLKFIHRVLYNWNACFPFCVVIWLLLLCWRRTKSHQTVLEMGAIALVVLYALIVTTLGGYRFDDYMRVHIVFGPLLILVVWSSLLMGASLIVQRGPCILAKLTDHAFSSKDTLMQ